MKVIAVHLDRCTGCKTCELYCATERGSNTKTLLQAAQESSLPVARVRVEGSNQVSVAIQCRQCLQAPCLDSCLTGALKRDENSGIIVIQESSCIGCWTCTLFCPYGAIYPWPDQKIALKCDRCLYLEIPVCVDVCPTEALELIDVGKYEEFLHHKRAAIAGDLQENKDDVNGKLLLDLIEVPQS